MKHSFKIWIMAAISLTVVGSLLFVGGLAALDFDFKKLSTKKYETNTYEVSEDFDKISIHAATTNIAFAPSDDETCKVECFEQEKWKHSVTVQNGTLIIDTTDTRKWYDHIGISFGNMKMTVYLPASEYTSLSINTDTGNVDMPKDFSFNSISVESDTGHIDWYASVSGNLKIHTATGYIKVQDIAVEEMHLSAATGSISIHSVTSEKEIQAETNTGNIQLTDVTGKTVTAKSDTGDISLKNVTAADQFVIENDTGDVRFDRSDAESIFVETDTGDVTGTLLSEKLFITETSTGRVNVPKTTMGGRCEITTDTGDIELTVG